MTNDIYCLTFVELVSYNNPQMAKELYLKSTIAFIFQCLLGLLFWSSSKGLGSINVGDMNMNCTRLLCVFLLHFIIIPEIKLGLQMLQYAKNNHSKFKHQDIFLVYIIGLMKLIGGIMCECLNCLIIVQSETTSDVIKDFIAFNIIVEIDDVLVSTMSDIDCD